MGRKKEIYQYIWFFHGALQLHSLDSYRHLQLGWPTEQQVPLMKEASNQP